MDGRKIATTDPYIDVSRLKPMAEGAAEEGAVAQGRAGAGEPGESSGSSDGSQDLQRIDVGEVRRRLAVARSDHKTRPPSSGGAPEHPAAPARRTGPVPPRPKNLRSRRGVAPHRVTPERAMGSARLLAALCAVGLVLLLWLLVLLVVARW